jgi:hypothetical protein
LTKQIEQAAWEEIMSRASDSEVIIIVPPKQPGGKSEVFTLNNMSPEFVEKLMARSKANATAIR